MRSVAFLVYPGYSMMAMAVVTAFEVANDVAGTTGTDPAYDIHCVSEGGGKVRTSAGMFLDSEPLTQMPFDTLIVCGAMRAETSTPGVIAYLKDALKRHRRVAALCTGAFILAEAGLLDGRRATTSLPHAKEFQRLFPKVRLEPDRIFINHGPFWTSASGMACLDLGLSLIESDLGAEFVKSVARKLVIYHRRSGNQSQTSALIEMAPKSDRIQMALTYARDNLHKALTVSELADAARLSPRQFSRAFLAETGQSPAKAIENLRVEVARDLMEQTRHPIDVVAQQTGFSDRDHLRRAFVRAFGQSPQVFRRNARMHAMDVPFSDEETWDALAPT